MKNILIALFVALIGVPGAAYAEKEAEPIKIGSILILTGEGSAWGNASRNGIEMAIEKINSSGGVLGRKLVAVHQDDRGDPKTAISAFRNLTGTEGVRFIIGPNWSNLGLPLIEMADSTKTIMISPSLGLAKFNESSKYLFNTWPHDSLLSEKLADYVYSKGHRTIALVGSEQVWVKEQTIAFKQRFEKLGGKIAFLTEPAPGTTDVKTDALKIKGTPGIDAVVSTTDGNIIGSLVAKALRDLHSKLPLFSITLDQAAIDASQGGFEGLEFLTFLTPAPGFEDAYESKYQVPVDIGADSAYDAVIMLAKVMKDAGSTDTGVVAEKLAGIKEYHGVSGRLTSDGKRGFTKPYAIKKVVNGKPAPLPAVQ